MQGGPRAARGLQGLLKIITHKQTGGIIWKEYNEGLQWLSILDISRGLSPKL